MNIPLVSIPNLKQALALIVDNELPTALFRRDIQGKWIITTSLVIVFLTKGRLAVMIWHNSGR